MSQPDDQTRQNAGGDAPDASTPDVDQANPPPKRKPAAKTRTTKAKKPSTRSRRPDSTREKDHKLPPGRPSKLDENVARDIQRALASGCYRESAARHAGVGVSTFFHWIEQGEADAAAGLDTDHSRLREMVLTTEADSEIQLLALVRRAANGRDGEKPQWQAAAWLLERKNPDKWGRRDRVALEGASGGAVEIIHNKVVEVVPQQDVAEEIAGILAEAGVGATTE